MPLASKIVEFSRKNLSARQIRFLLAKNILSRLPAVREKYACYAETISVKEVSSGMVLSEEFHERIELDSVEADYYRTYRKDICCPMEGDSLIVESSIAIHEIGDCEILPKSLAVLHAPSRRVIVREGGGIERNLMSPFAYRGRIEVPGISFSLMSSPKGHSHYFHFLFDLLKPLIWYCRRHPDSGPVKVLVREKLAPHQQQALSALVAAFPYIVIRPMPGDVRISCERLYVPGVRGGFAPQHLGDKETLIRMRDVLVGQPTDDDGTVGHRRLLVSRKSQKTRRLVNEDEITGALAPIGVEAVLPETLSFEAQMRLFAGAEIVAAACGAALTNMLFCRPGTTVVEFCPTDIHIPYWIVLAKQMELTHRFVPGSEGGVYQAFSVDAAGFERAVKSVVGL